MERIVILTGAGISAESGLGTFRDAGGLWSEYNLADVATPEGYARDPKLVLDFYNARRANCRGTRPNAAHRALARLEAGFPGAVTLVTQNIDDLHERAGHREVWHMHGEITRALCNACGHRWNAPEVMKPSDSCASCGVAATRPDVVWFGEIPYMMQEIEERLASCDLFVSIGTSGEVYPAAGFVSLAADAGARRLELNLEPTPAAHLFHEQRQGPATRLVPDWVAEVLGG